MVKQYKVMITEVLSRTIAVEASNWKEAQDKVMDMYYNADVVISSDDHETTEFEVLN